MDSRIFNKRIQHRFYHACASDCDSDSDVDGLSTSSLPLTETCMEYFQDSFPGSEGLGRLDMPMAATVTKRNQVSPCSVVLSMMYAKRLRQRNRQYLQSMSSTDVFFISMMMASKYLYDEGVDEEVYNDEWAASVGHETDDVNQMEMDFLKEMDWQLFAKHEDFDKALTAVERRLALKEGVKRGWFTYTEMSVLLDWDPICNLWNQVGMDCTKVVSLLSAVYVTSLVSMMGSAAVAIQLSGPVASATVAAVLSLQASTMSSTSLASNPITPASLSCNQSSMDTVVVGADNMIDAVAQDIALSAGSPMHSGMDEDFVSSHNGFDQNCSNFPSDKATDGEENYPRERPENSGTISKQKMKGATSVFSMWLFDSLISQVWSVFGADDDLRRDVQQNSASDTGVGVKGFRGKPCDNCGHVENTSRKGNRDRAGKRCRTQQGQAATHISVKDGHDNGRTVSNGAVDRCLGSRDVQGCGASSNTECSRVGGDRRLTDHSSVLSSDPCQCFSSSPSSSNCCHQLDSFVSENSFKTHREGGDGSSSSTHHGPPPRHEAVGKSTEFVLPLSLMTEVPILDPIGFFTKDSRPTNYVLST